MSVTEYYRLGSTIDAIAERAHQQVMSGFVLTGSPSTRCLNHRLECAGGKLKRGVSLELMPSMPPRLESLGSQVSFGLVSRDSSGTEGRIYFSHERTIAMYRGIVADRVSITERGLETGLFDPLVRGCFEMDTGATLVCLNVESQHGMVRGSCLAQDTDPVSLFRYPPRKLLSDVEIQLGGADPECVELSARIIGAFNESLQNLSEMV